MAGPFDLTGVNIEDSYQRILQTPDGVNIYDGTGSAFTVTAVAAPAGPNQSIQFNDAGATSGSGDFTFDKTTNVVSLTGSISAVYGFTGSLLGTASTASNTPNALVTGSITGNVITLTKGNGTSFNLTVDTGSATQIDTSSFVTTSSFNSFTSSFNSFTSSYNTGSFTGSFTGSILGTASYYQETDPVFVAKSASLATTGSNIFIGNQTVTGSLFTTGSNELVGNTILSGTLQIQGEYPPSAGSASVSIVGNVDLNGYLRFDHQVKIFL